MDVTAPFLIAEISGNHGGSYEKALDLIDAAKAAGADAVKFQTYEAGTITLDHDGPAFRIEGELWRGDRLFDLYKKAQTPFGWHSGLFQHAGKVGITAFSAPFDETAVALLEELNTPFYKIASCELVDMGLIKAVAETGKPIIMSTGMATEAEIEEALNQAVRHRAGPICLLHCVSGYPTPVDAYRLETIPYLRERFGVDVGLSDHSEGITVAIAATALGACVIEKHFYLADGTKTVDDAFSLGPDAFKNLVTQVKQAAKALKGIRTAPLDAERDTLRFRRSLYIVNDIKQGDVFTADNVKSIRPAGGLHTRYLPDILGKRALRDAEKGTPLSSGMVADFETDFAQAIVQDTG